MDSVKCEGCGVEGGRPRGKIAPEAWLFLEARDEESGRLTVVYACSDRCAMGLWRRGPGQLVSATEKEKQAPVAFPTKEMSEACAVLDSLDGFRVELAQLGYSLTSVVVHDDGRLRALSKHIDPSSVIVTGDDTAIHWCGVVLRTVITDHDELPWWRYWSALYDPDPASPPTSDNERRARVNAYIRALTEGG